MDYQVACKGYLYFIGFFAPGESDAIVESVVVLG